MTTDIAAIGLEYDLVDIQDTDGIFLQIVSGLDDGYDVRGQDVVVPSADGRVVRPRRFDRIVVVLEGYVRGVGVDQDAARMDYRANRRILADLFAPDRDVADLRVVLEDGDIARLSCRPMPSMALVEVVQSEFANVSIELEAVSRWEGLGS